MNIKTNSVAVSNDLDLESRLQINIDNLELDALCSLEPETITRHPNRAYLLALIGLGNIHRKDVSKGVSMVLEAIRYGLKKEVAAKLLLRGLNISIARSYAALGDTNRAASRLIDFYLLGSNGAKVAFDESIHSLISGVKADIEETSSMINPSVGQFDKYCIHKFYVSRESYHHYDDSQAEDHWQLEVYLHAYYLMKKNGFTRLFDVGCGSGYKLIRYLGDFDTVGSELSFNLKLLNERYPTRKWVESNFDSSNIVDAELIICSDVIEHLVDPDLLINWLKRQSASLIVLSTPDRDLVYQDWELGKGGPPNNPAHVREWNFQEFENYISKHFNVLEHKVTNSSQATQMIVCSKIY